ncbi:hypothetical protein ACFE04_006491 [Oxalis oulophora]
MNSCFSETTSRLSPLAKPFTISTNSSQNFQLNDLVDDSITGKLGYTATMQMNKSGNVPTPSNNAPICVHLPVTSEKLLTNRDEDINCELQLICPRVPDGVVTFKPLRSIGNSSLSCDYDDSDIDSPCWKGTLNQSTFGVSKPVDAHVFKIEAKCLNPRALQFYPGSGKIDHETFHEKECANVFSAETEHLRNSSVAESAGLTETLLCSSMAATQKFDVPKTNCGVSEHVVDAKIKNSAEEINGLNPLAPQFYPSNGKIQVNHRAKECVIDDSPYVVKPTSLAVVPAAQVHQNFLFGSSSNNEASDFQDSRESENAVLTSSFLSNRENDVDSPFYEVGASSESSKTFSGDSKRNTPKISVHMLINSMHEMSEKLIQNCTNGFYSLSEQQQKKIENIISNLHTCTRKKDQQRISKPDLIGQFKSYELVNKSDVTMKNFTIPHVGRPLDRFSFFEDIGLSNDMTDMQPVRNTLNSYHTQAEEDMIAQTLLYKKLWFEAEESLHCLKYKMAQMEIKQHVRIESMDDSSIRGRERAETQFRGSLHLPDRYYLE